MTTYSNNCVGCGCGPAIPEPCITPPPVCLDPQPCTEIINAECVIYTGPAITCSQNSIIPSNTSVAEALEALVDYLCLGACCSTPTVVEIDNPDFILLCTDSTATCAHVGKLYNWFTLNLGVTGTGRVAGGIVNINALDNPVNTWRVPNNNDWYALALALDPLATQTPWVNASGGKIKSTTCWSLPNSGATNSSGLGVSPTVVRSATTGFFATNNGQKTRYWSGNDNTATTYAVELDYITNILAAINPASYKFGYKVRLVRPIDCNEADGDFIANAYKDNNGNFYNAEVIGNLVWLNSDLIDIKYNNGTSISNVILDAPWIAATLGAWCYPNNSSTFTITYVDGCEEVKISFEDFLDFIPTSTQTFIVSAAAGIQVNPTVIGSQTTYTVTNTDPGSAVTLASAGGTETLVNDGVGPALATKGLKEGAGIALPATGTDVTITNTDPGSAQNIFKNIAVATQSTIVADTNNDTLTVVAGAGIDITTNALTDEITITNTDPGSGVTLADAGLDPIHESLVNDGLGAALAVKGLVAGPGITLSTSATDIKITNTELFPSFLEYNTTDITVWNNGQGNISTNTSFGDSALRSNTIGNQNTAIGANALNNNITGDDNTAIGYDVLTLNTTGVRNAAVGNFALRSNNANDNTAIGYNALRNSTTGINNTVIGSGAMFLDNQTSNNTIIGFNAFANSNNSFLSNNVIIGSNAAVGYAYENVAIGSQAQQNGAAAFSIAIGYQAMINVGLIYYSIAIGHSALQNAQNSSRNIAIGWESLKLTNNATDNVAVGNSTLRQNTTGGSNSAFGNSALMQNTTAFYNSAFGNNASSSNTTGQQNVSMGANALAVNTTGSFNTALGRWAIVQSTTASNNTAVGYRTLFATTTGTENAILGVSAGAANTTGSNNTFIGYLSSDDNVASNSNTVVGSNTKTGNFSGSTILGRSATATANNQFVVGSASVNAGTVQSEIKSSTKTWSVIINGVAQKILLE